MARYCIEVMYDGTAFHGSQLQGDIPTVQLAINTALTTLLRTPTLSFGASRTDEGVHALCNCYHFDTEEPLNDRFLYKMNAVLPEAVAVKDIYMVSNTFNARFDAISRRYRYRIYQHKNPFLLNKALFNPFTLNTGILNTTASIIKEYQDFESFSKRRAQTKTFICTISQSLWECKEGELHYIVEGNRFLRGMVRGLVATQLKAAKGKLTLEGFRAIIEAKDCTKAYFNVTGHGLYLEQITYPEGALQRIKQH